MWTRVVNSWPALPLCLWNWTCLLCELWRCHLLFFFLEAEIFFSFPYHWEWTPALLTENWWRKELLPVQLLHGGVLCHSLVCIRPWWSNLGLSARWFCSSIKDSLHLSVCGSQPSHLADQGKAQQLTGALGQKLLEPEAVESSPPAHPAKERCMHCPSAFWTTYAPRS